MTREQELEQRVADLEGQLSDAYKDRVLKEHGFDDSMRPHIKGSTLEEMTNSAVDLGRTIKSQFAAESIRVNKERNSDKTRYFQR